MQGVEIDHTFSREREPAGVLLSSEDRQWLEALGCQWPDEAQEPEWLRSFNALAVSGSQDIDLNGSPDESVATFESRKLFFAQLPSINDAVEKLSLTHKWLMPPSTVVGLIRTLHAKNVDISAAANHHPRLLSYSGPLIGKRLEVISSLGVDVGKAATNCPALLFIVEADLETRAREIFALGMNADKVLKKHPYLLTYPTDTLKQKMEALDELGINVTRVVNTNPSLLGNEIDTIKTKLDSINDLGLDAISIVNASPSTLSMTPEKLRSKYTALQQMGLDPLKTIRNNPKVLEFAEANLRKKVRTIKAIGRLWREDPVETISLIETWPQILGYKADRVSTVARIITKILELPQLVLIKDVQSLLMADITAVVVAYLEQQQNVTTPHELRNMSLRYKKLGNEALRHIIIQHPNDSIVKSYLRGYPILAA